MADKPSGARDENSRALCHRTPPLLKLTSLRKRVTLKNATGHGGHCLSQTGWHRVVKSGLSDVIPLGAILPNDPPRRVRTADPVAKALFLLFFAVHCR
jgi:hypothetical protein